MLLGPLHHAHDIVKRMQDSSRVLDNPGKAELIVLV